VDFRVAYRQQKFSVHASLFGIKEQSHRALFQQKHHVYSLFPDLLYHCSPYRRFKLFTVEQQQL
jgi:hypothetical protein